MLGTAAWINPVARGGDARRELGTWGERIAAAHLRERGMVVLARNWACREGELDLVATDGKVLAFCEVKTRSGRAFGPPEEAVTAEKRSRLRRLACLWLQENKVGWCGLRFDVISVEAVPGTPIRLRHIEGAF